MQTAPERPDRVTPVPEEYEGVNFPYRGSQNHGVPQQQNIDPESYYDHTQYDDGEIPATLPAEKEADPIPVKIVQDTARERLQIRFGNFLAQETGQAIVNRHEKRRVLTLFNNDSTNSVYLGEEAGVRVATGFELEAGKQIEIRSTEEVWVITDPTITVKVSYAWEYAVEL